jgi:serine/threonine-protein kinase
MLQWSDLPLEIFRHDPRSPVHRLPEGDQAWIERSGVVLLVPVRGEGLLGVIVLGAKRSEEAYTEEDRQLLGSIAAQVALGLDVARLRRRVDSAGAGETTGMLTPASQPMMECPTCGRCEEPGTARCPSDDAMMHPVPTVPRVIDQKYRIEQRLGRGGMGAVYRARDVRLDRLVALKVVRAELLGNPEARQRFRREAQIVAGLQHPSIVSVFDYGTFVDGGAYLVMELVRGEDLRRVLQREGRLDVERALRILGAVCAAIECAHREGVLHRDLKPENILLPGGGLDAKVLDFGVAKVVRDEAGEHDTRAAAGSSMLTATGMIVGTPAYMAPEQLRGLAPDVRCDIFSLGVVAYEMLTGELPFGRGSLADIVLAHAKGVPSFPAGGLPADLEHAIRSALDPDPDERPPSASAFAQLLVS